MREDELRDLLVSYTEPEGRLPTPEEIRMRAGKRRATLVGAAALSVVTVVALAVTAQGGRGPSLAVPAGSPTQSAPASATPTATAPSRTPTPGLTCVDVQRAWHDALASTPRFPAVLGTSPRLVSALGDAVVASGVVRGQRVVRVFPHGLAGDSYALPPLAAGLVVSPLSLDAGRLVYMEAATAEQGVKPWRILVADAPGVAPRELVAGGVPAGGGLAVYQPWVDQGFLRWFDVLPDPTGSPGARTVTLKELPLDQPGAQPRTVRELDGMPLQASRTNRLVLLYGTDRWRALDRATLLDQPVPAGLDDVKSALSVDGDRILYLTVGDTGNEEIWLYDASTGLSRPVLAGSAFNASLEGNLVLARHPRSVTLTDLDTNSTIKVADHGNFELGPFLSDGHLVRDANETTKDPGTVVDLAGLPHSIPPC